MRYHLSSLILNLCQLGVWLLIISAIFIPLERVCARQKQPILRKEWAIDLTYYFINPLLLQLLLVLPLAIIARTIHHWEPNPLYTWMASLPMYVRFGLAIVVGEVGAYWGHRWSHEIPFLWRFHAVHHSAEAMDWLVNTRAHPLDLGFTRICGLVLIYLVGLAQPNDATDIVPILYAIGGKVWSFFIHANLNWRLGFVERLISTPAFHHWHHNNDDREAIDKNYAAILPIMDILFGTFYLPKTRFPQKYGIETPIGTSFTRQLLQPLRWG
jgi:sterol desaturase/sphingolipid hydroxylase (fatty acid hydroxylase superfamily)